MRSILRSVGVVLLGTVVAMAIIIAVEGLGQKLYPAPASRKLADPGTLKLFIAGLPTGAFSLVLGGWAVASVVGAWIASRIAAGRRLVHGMVVGFLLLLAGVANMLMLPHPLWFVAVGILVFPLGATLGTALAARR